MKTFFRAGLLVHVSLVIAISACAYTGVVPTKLPALPHLDLLGHAIGIGGLAFFLDGVLERRPLLRDLGSLGGGVVLLVASIEEYAQRLSPRRSSSWDDLAADVVGVVLAVWLSRRLAAAWRRRAQLEIVSV